MSFRSSSMIELRTICCLGTPQLGYPLQYEKFYQSLDSFNGIKLQDRNLSAQTLNFSSNLFESWYFGASSRYIYDQYCVRSQMHQSVNTQGCRSYRHQLLCDCLDIYQGSFHTLASWKTLRVYHFLNLIHLVWFNGPLAIFIHNLPGSLSHSRVSLTADWSQ